MMKGKRKEGEKRRKKKKKGVKRYISPKSVCTVPTINFGKEGGGKNSFFWGKYIYPCIKMDICKN